MKTKTSLHLLVQWLIGLLLFLVCEAPRGRAYQAPEPQPANRRAFLATMTSRMTVMTSTPFLVESSPFTANANAATPQYIGSTVMIQNYPELQYLVPIYTFQQSLEILSYLLDPDLLEKLPIPNWLYHVPHVLWTSS